MEASLQQLNKTSLKLLEPLSLEDTYKNIVEEAIKLVGAEYGSIVLMEGEELKRVYASSSVLYQTQIPKNGFIHKTLLSHRSIVVGINELKNLYPEIESRGIKSLFFIPLSYKRKATGVLTLQSKKSQIFKTKQLDTLSVFGSMATLAIQKSQFQTKTEKAEYDKNIYRSLEIILEKINRSALKFLEPLDPEKTYEIITNEAIKLINGKYGSLVLVENNSLKQVYSTLPILVVRRKQGFTYRTIQKNRVHVLYVKESKEFQKAHPEFSPLNLQTHVNIPLSYKKRSLGTVTVNLEIKKTFTERELDTLVLFGSLASLAIRKAQLHNETKRAVEVRDLFISLAAHELRTPLTTINGYIQLLSRQIPPNKRPVGTWVAELLWESKRLTTLVNELLEVNRVKAGQFNYTWQECNIRTAIQRSINVLGFTYPGRKILFKDSFPQHPDKIIGDLNKLIQVFSNILENAVKFSSPESEIVIGLTFTNKYGIVSIEDHGKGIDKKDMPNLFEVFYKGTNTNEVEGMGMGLFLTKTIVNQHHGEIKVYSKLNKGTKVEIKLPLSKV